MALFGNQYPRYLAFVDDDGRRYAAYAPEDSPASVTVACPAGHRNKTTIADLTRRARMRKYPCQDCEWRLLFTAAPQLRRFYRGMVPEDWVVATSTDPLPWEDKEGRWNESPASIHRRALRLTAASRSVGRPDAPAAPAAPAAPGLSAKLTAMDRERQISQGRRIRAELVTLSHIKGRHLTPEHGERAEELLREATELLSRAESYRGASSQPLRDFAPGTIRRAERVVRNISTQLCVQGNVAKRQERVSMLRAETPAERHARRVARTRQRRGDRRWLGRKLATGGEAGSRLEEAVFEQLGADLTASLALNTTAVISPLELDAFSPGVGAAIEVNGEPFHTEERVGAEYHRWKWEMCQAAGVDLYTVWSAHWNHRRDGVLCDIRRVLRQSPTYPGLDDPEVITHTEAAEFLHSHSTEAYPTSFRYSGIRDQRGNLLYVVGYRHAKNRLTVLRAGSNGYVPGATAAMIGHLTAEARRLHDAPIPLLWKANNLSGWHRELTDAGMLVEDSGDAAPMGGDPSIWDAGVSTYLMG